MKNRKIGIAAFLVCLLLGCTSFIGLNIYKNKTKGIEQTEISTGEKNKCLEYDEETGMLFVGTHTAKLFAYQEGEELWSASANGPFSQLKLEKETGLLYAANEDNHIYIYEAENGRFVRDIDVQRRVMGMDISKDGSKIAVRTLTGSKKANLLIFQSDGTQLQNTSFKNKLLGLAFCEDGSLLIGNNRGEVKKITETGEELASYKFPKGVKDLVKSAGAYWVLSEDGSYYQIDENLEIVRQGKADNSVQATMSKFGVDADGEYVLIGTEQGYLYVCDGSDSHFYTEKIDMEITDFYAVGKNVYLTGTKDLVDLVHVENLANINRNLFFIKVFRIVMIMSIVLLLLCVVMLIPASNRYMCKLCKRIWKNRMAYVLILPTAVLLFLFSYRGIFLAFSRAFTNWSVKNSVVADIKFIGLENFINMFRGDNFIVGMKNVVLLTVTGLIKTLTVPLGIAWLVYNIRGDKRKYIHRFLFVLPIVVPGVVATMTWLRIYDPTTGLINNLLAAMNLESWQRVWLGDERLAIWAVIFMGFPFIGAMAFLVYYGGLINIGKELEESAMIDGASRFQIFRDIQFPLLKPQRNILILLCIIGNMQDFNSIFILTNGGPGNSTYVPALELYLNVARSGQYGYASAMGVVLTIFTVGVTLISNWLTREKE